MTASELIARNIARHFEWDIPSEQYNVVHSAIVDAASFSKRDILLQALKDAVETIHGEFCGSGKHHSVCDTPRQTIEAIDPDWKPSA